MGEITGNGQAQTGLGGAAGYGEVALARGDDTSFAIDASAVFENGFSIGGVTYAADALFVSTDGFLTFGASPNGGYLNNPNDVTAPVIAVFMADIDTRLDGEGTESGPIWVDIDPVNDVVTITWQDVGFYRRNADLTNTFQIQLFDRGADGIEVVFRYESIEWTSGDMQGGWNGLDGQAATIGLRLQDWGVIQILEASGSGAAQLDLPTTIGNTGVAGLWVFTIPLAGAATGLPDQPSGPGGAGGDLVTGTLGNDALFGYGGNDTLIGGAGGDYFYGGSDFDTVSYASSGQGVVANLANPVSNTQDAAGDVYQSIEALEGSAFADYLHGDAFANRIVGGAGDDTLVGYLGADTLIGGSGFDIADYSEATAGVTVNLSDNSRNAGFAQGDDLREIEGIRGSSHNDLLIGAALGELLIGGAGDDTLQGGVGADTLHGGGGFDWVSYQGSGAVAIDLLAGSFAGGHAAGDVLDGIEGVIGSSGGDAISGTAASDYFYGGAGGDTLAGRGGNDRLHGDDGNDTLIGGAGRDTLDGSAGHDIASYADAAGPITANLANPSQGTGDAEGDVYNLIEGLIGGQYADRLSGDQTSNTILGGGGDDLIFGGAGHDTLSGEAGNDTILAGLGNNSLAGGDGDDSLQSFAGIGRLEGGAGSDYLAGGFQADALFGGGGDDVLRGDSGGYLGGSDQLGGGAGDDLLMGGFGADTFIFAPNDGTDTIAAFDATSLGLHPVTGYHATITGADFNPSVDHIQLAGFSGLYPSNVMNYVTDTAQGAQFSAMGTTVVIYGVSAAQLGADNFLFSA